MYQTRLVLIVLIVLIRSLHYCYCTEYKYIHIVNTYIHTYILGLAHVLLLLYVRTIPSSHTLVSIAKSEPDTAGQYILAHTYHNGGQF